MISVFLQEVRSHGWRPDPKLNHLSHNLIYLYYVDMILIIQHLYLLLYFLQEINQQVSVYDNYNHHIEPANGLQYDYYTGGHPLVTIT